MAFALCFGCLCAGAWQQHSFLPSLQRDAASMAPLALSSSRLTGTYPLWNAPRAPAPVAFADGPQKPSLPPASPTLPPTLGLRARRWLYEALEPLDKGDFRWEFLVPWTNKTLTTVDKFIVCSTFIGLSFTLQTVLDPGASVGVHLSYIAQFFSYAMGDPIGFRLLAVLTALLEIGGNLFETKEAGLIVNGADFNLLNAFSNVNDEDVFPIFYDQLFIVINGYYILRWLLTQEAIASALEWSDDAEALYGKCFAPLGFRRAQFSRLLRLATFVRVSDAEADVLTVQGEPIYDLFVPLNGTLEVRVGGAVASTLPSFQLVGEASLLENLQSPGGAVHPPARATVVAAPGSYYVRWPQSAFYGLQEEEDSDFAYAIQLMIARTLSEKLSAARISQMESLQRLEGRKIAAFGGGVNPVALAAERSSPMALATKRLGEQGAAAEQGAARPRMQGAAAEAKALLEQNQQTELQVRMLERSLAVKTRELADLKVVIFLVVSLLLLLAGSSVALSSLLSDWSKGGWAHSFESLAADELLMN